MLLMLAVVGIYSLTSLNDKYAVSKAKYNGAQLTFLMAAGTAPFLAMLLPWADRTVSLTWQAAAAILAIALSKYLEFAMSAKILKSMSAFELKAWVGILLFVSYFTDAVMYSFAPEPLHILFIVFTTLGLAMIAVSGRGKVEYKKIALPLVLYLAARFGYGFVMKAAGPYISSTMTLLFALIVLALAMLPFAKPWTISGTSPEGMKGLIIVLLCKIPNAFGLMGENAVAAKSLTNFSFIPPMILIVLFVVSLFKKNTRPTGLNLAGSAVCVVGILGFQIVDVMK
ncbi:MAG: hypothetical protein IKP47_02200 [Ruminococcus sp.]|nr:hypothetical protein [Ruminococcus sp.]